MVHKIIYALSIGVVLVMTSCAAIINGRTKNITITSYTPDVKMYLDGVAYEGQDRMDIQVKRNEDHKIVVRKPGYKTKEIILEREMSPVTILDWAFGWVFLYVPIIVDYFNGGMFTFEPSHYEIELEQDNTP